MSISISKVKKSSLKDDGYGNDFMKNDSTLVVPGQTITGEQGFLRGHGSYYNPASGELVASVSGRIERVNKLISVLPARHRYIGEVGDLIVGRITAVESKRWRADIRGLKDASLQLSSVNLPGGVQRMRTYEDQLQMRELYTENDLISAEIQNIGGDGAISLHTRSLKYGKLENGQLVTVPSALVPRLPQHYLTLPLAGGIDIILGRNGMIWITRAIPAEWRAQGQDADDSVPLAETLQRLRTRHRETALLQDQRMMVARVRNAICILARHNCLVSPDTISSVVSLSEQLGVAAKDMLSEAASWELTAQLSCAPLSPPAPPRTPQDQPHTPAPTGEQPMEDDHEEDEED